jgi:hypothetical protein
MTTLSEPTALSALCETWPFTSPR